MIAHFNYQTHPWLVRMTWILAVLFAIYLLLAISLWTPTPNVTRPAAQYPIAPDRWKYLLQNLTCTPTMLDSVFVRPDDYKTSSVIEHRSKVDYQSQKGSLYSTQGHWQFNDDAELVRQRNGLAMKYHDQFLNPDRKGDPSSWEWVTSMKVDRFDPSAYCSYMRNNSILFVGDSLTANMMASIRRQLNINSQGRQAVTRSCQMSDFNYEYEHSTQACAEGSRVDYIRNDHLTLEQQQCGDVCNHWADVEKLHTYSHLVLNSGMHIIPVQEYQRNLRKAVDFLLQIQYNGTVYYRLSVAGHVNCMNYFEPIKPSDYIPIADGHKFSWDLIPTYVNL